MRYSRALLAASRAALAVVRQNRWRSLLTLAICGLGTAGVIVSSVVGQAHLSEMNLRLKALGGRLVIVSPNKVPPYPSRVRQLDHFISLEADDASTVAKRVARVQAVIPVVSRNSTLRLGHSACRIRLLGTQSDYARVRDFRLAQGRFLLPADEGQQVIVLGHAASRELSSEGVFPGEMVLLGGQPYEVVGVLEPQGVNFAGEDEDHQAFIPLETYRLLIANRFWLSHLYLQLAPDADAEAVVKTVQQVLRERHNRRSDQVDDVIVRDMADVAVQQSSLLAAALWVVSVTSGLLELVGIVGIATLMLQVVRQRRGEIGLRRALGATPFDIALQFFMEGMGLAAIGVISGLTIGVLSAGAAQALTSHSVVLELPFIVASVSFALVAASLACLMPAIKAARMEPAAALRS